MYGEPGAGLSGRDDLVEARPPGSDTERRALGLAAGRTPAVRRLISQGQLVCDATVGGRGRALLPAVRGGCTLIGADEHQSRIDPVWEQPAGAVTESHPPDQERPKRR